MFYTYFHTRNDTGAVFYVGKGQGARATTSKSRNRHWHNIVAKAGFASHVAARWPTEQEALDHEIFLIDCFKGIGVELCNIMAGGEGAATGMKHCAETRLQLRAMAARQMSLPGAREAVRAANVGNAIWLGRRHKPESIEKMRKVTAQQMADPAMRERLRVANLGKTASAETRAKMSATAKGHDVAQATRDKLRAKALAQWARRKAAA